MRLDDATAEKLERERETIRIWTPAPTVIVTRIQGHASLEGLRFYTSRADRLLARTGRLFVFHHWAGITSWEPTVRDELRRWAALHDGRLPGTHFLVQSRMLAMAIEVAALVLGRKLHSHGTEATFFAELDRVLASERRGR